MTNENLDKLEALLAKATPGEWYWNSYSSILTSVPKGDHMDDSGDDPEEPGYAFLMQVAQSPKYRGHGDELHDPETQDNARLVAVLHNAAPELLRLARLGLAVEGARC